MKVGAPVPPPADPTVEAWTEAMGAALEAVTLNADDWKDHEVVAAVDALYGRSVEKNFLEGEEGQGQRRAVRSAFASSFSRARGVSRNDESRRGGAPRATAPAPSTTF